MEDEDDDTSDSDDEDDDDSNSSSSSSSEAYLEDLEDDDQNAGVATDSDDEDEEEVWPKPAAAPQKPKKRKGVLLGVDEDEDISSSSSTQNESADPKMRAKLKDLSVDYARGEGRIDSESSSSEEEEDSDEEDQKETEEETVQFDKWGEMDADAEATEEATARLAVCNMDWDRVAADDIFLALSSFCPPGGSVRRVRVFVSDFGERRLAEEERLGPEELRARDAAEAEAKYEDEDEPELDEKEAERRAMEKVRAYQVNRLRYYYAVADMDSAESANAVYTECDGKEYELSATRFDLRFIPEDMEFEERQPTSTCASMPDPQK